MSDEDEIYIKIAALDEIYNFVVLSFSFQDVKMLKKLIYNFRSIITAYKSLSVGVK
jgi:hypothetical protein